MFKIKVFRSASGHKKYPNIELSVTDYIYCIYLFGYLIHSVTITDVRPDVAAKMMY